MVSKCMPKRPKQTGSTSKPVTIEGQPAQLKGWKAIADYLGIGESAAQRWARTGMPVRREGRFTIANVDELRAWLGRESHMAKPAFVATGQADLSAPLKESILAARRARKTS